MQIRIKEKQVLMTRDNYKGIKKYDRNQMQQMLQAMYDEEVEDGQAQIPEITRIKQGISIAADALIEALESTKGIGEKRREEIVQKFRAGTEKRINKVEL